MLHIDLQKGRAAIIEASGDCHEVAGQVAAAVGVIYSHLCDTGTVAGDEFRDAITQMLADDAIIWEECRKAKYAGGGGSIVISPPTGKSGQCG